MFLAGIGLYGVLMLSVAERRAEIGLRRALGADRTAVLKLVLREIVPTVGAGAAAGLLVALSIKRLIGGILFGVGPIDARAMAAALGLVAMVAMVAAVLPALRALRVAPAHALDAEG